VIPYGHYTLVHVNSNYDRLVIHQDAFPAYSVLRKQIKSAENTMGFGQAAGTTYYLKKFEVKDGNVSIEFMKTCMCKEVIDNIINSEMLTRYNLPVQTRLPVQIRTTLSFEHPLSSHYEAEFGLWCSMYITD
jgi:hypothetical protein